jgi:hypothetical protein
MASRKKMLFFYENPNELGYYTFGVKGENDEICSDYDCCQIMAAHFSHGRKEVRTLVGNSDALDKSSSYLLQLAAQEQAQTRTSIMVAKEKDATAASHAQQMREMQKQIDALNARVDKDQLTIDALNKRLAKSSNGSSTYLKRPLASRVPPVQAGQAITVFSTVVDGDTDNGVEESAKVNEDQQNKRIKISPEAPAMEQPSS